ncbi:MAG: magnesium transporter CorA family protein [Methylobacteriaceae bacterium]|nr:magnesium transporter CorA family protein [Methylobacteriaceae bacterium]
MRDGKPLDSLEGVRIQENAPLPENAVWIDLLYPEKHEEGLVEQWFGIDIPTREEMADIEPSEILYFEDNARYMTARVLCHTEADGQHLTDVSFILVNGKLVTVRYEAPTSFSMFISRAAKPGGCPPLAEGVLDGLMEAIIDRAAEILAVSGKEIDSLSHSVFQAGNKSAGSKQRSGEIRYRRVLGMLGRKADVVSNVRESMASIERLLLFLSVNLQRPQKASGFQAEWRTAVRDVQSIEEHATFLSNKIQFLLDATLGLVNIEQNDIIKLFSVVSVVFMPPTLIASIYGMNFSFMPELQWVLGYPMALLLMVAAAVFPYVFFRWKRWL